MKWTTGLLLMALLYSCQGRDTGQVNDQAEGSGTPSGKLFIIGGGKRPPEMVATMLETAGIDSGDIILTIPLASEEPDTAAFYAEKQFAPHGSFSIRHLMIDSSDIITDSLISLVREAKLIYIPGGDQSKLMKLLLHTPLHRALLEAYTEGAMIAGTSAGAAVMSHKMITGNQKKHPEYTGDFQYIEAENMEITEGLGFLQHAIIDQHFIVRMRMNRLISVAIEHPEEMCIGIDESTAILVQGDSARVTGLGQVVVLKNKNGSIKSSNGLLGAEGLSLSVYLPGDVFSIH